MPRCSRCWPPVRSFLPAILVLQLAGVGGVLPPTNPPWPAVWNMSLSTISMQCNGSGWSDPARGGQFGIVSYDWSNAKAQWAKAKPMDCEARLQAQAAMTKRANPMSRVFVYRNVVKALPWFRTVREKLDDPAFAGWFLKFDRRKKGKTGTSYHYHVPDCAPENSSKCSAYYHDQEQTPEVPTAKQPHPDGSCHGACDCGSNPCGEYLFDFRNGSMLRDWIVDELILGPTALGDPNIAGTFIDDFWCSDLLCRESNNTIAGCPCKDPVQGPTEIDRYAQTDMGLSDEDIREITIGWNATMTAVQRAHLAHGGYTWSLIPGQENANAMPVLLTPGNCELLLEQACPEADPSASASSPHSSLVSSAAAAAADPPAASGKWQSLPLLFGLQINHTSLSPSQLESDLAFFLLARGPHAYLGWGVWGMTWPFNPEAAHGELPPLPHGAPRPAMIDRDYGTPLGPCRKQKQRQRQRKREQQENSATVAERTGTDGAVGAAGAAVGGGGADAHASADGVVMYTREWTKATVSLTCGAGRLTGHIQMRE